MLISEGFKVSVVEKREENVTGDCKVWGLRSSEDDVLLGCDTVWTRRYIWTLWRNIGIYLWVHSHNPEEQHHNRRLLVQEKQGFPWKNDTTGLV
jgi:hypothetical protein